MSFPWGRSSTKGRRTGSSRIGHRVRATASLLLIAAFLINNSTALAAWIATATGASASRATSMPTGNLPTAGVTGRNITVSWSGNSLSDGTPINNYIVKRYDGNGAEQATNGSCSGTVSALTCTESGVTAGPWRYTVTPKKSNWLGTASPLSVAVTVGSASMSLSPSTLTSLPSTTTASLSNFISGQTVTFRLDDSTSGTILSSTLTPSTVPTSGSASASVTIPSGTSNGTHTVYAIGSQGDVVGASLVVSVPVPQSITTAPYNVRDASSGTETDVSHQFAFAGDGKTAGLSAWGTAYSASRYLDFNMSTAAPSGLSVSGATFDFTFSSSGANQTCFYFEVRRVSTGAVLATHGDATTPVACATSTTMVSTSTALPEVTTTAIANDLKIRVFGKNAASLSSIEDLATVTATTASGTFTLFAASVGDAASGAAPVTYPWSLEAADGTLLVTTSGWDTAFNTSKYMKLSYPAYAPSGASAVSATFTHSYRADTTGTTACYYFEVLSGTTLLATHGSSASPVSCNSSSITNVTDTVSLPEVDTVGKANNLVIKIYGKDSSTQSAAKRKTSHDAAKVTINFST